MRNYNEYRDRIYKDNTHWWTDLKTGLRIQRDIPELLALTISELAEALEGERKDLMDDHLPHRKMAEVEMADAAIRLFDLAGGYNLDLDQCSDVPDCPLPDNRASAIFFLMVSATDYMSDSFMANFDQTGDKNALGCLVSASLRSIESYCNKFGYDLWAALEEKHAYNRTRADHKLEARLAPGGKKF